jgi:formylglycine-generating enzyme required for sulfatase activity
VDWCDAFAYCAAAGKRLCGGIGGGAGDFADGFKDPQKSEWMAACTNGGTTTYPYGNGYVGGACDGKDYTHPNQTVPVGSAVVCRGVTAPYGAIFDMSGNVAEWEDACSGASGSGDLCRRRGGSFKDGPGPLRCDADDGGFARSSADALTGFRCCGG